MRILFWITCLCALGGAWLIFQIESSKNCLSTVIVRSFKISQIERVTELPICKGSQNHPISTKWIEKVDHFQSEISYFERLFLQVAPSLQRIEIEILEKEPKIFRTERNKIQMGVDIAFEKGAITRSLVYVWLERMNPYLIKDRVLFESAVDFLTSVSRGDQLETEWSVFKHIYSYEGLCESSWRPYSQAQLCSALKQVLLSEGKDSSLGEKLKTTAESSMREMTAFSMRPVLSKIFWELYIDFSLSERINIVKSFINNIVASKIDFKESSYTTLSSWRSVALERVHWFFELVGEDLPAEKKEALLNRHNLVAYEKGEPRVPWLFLIDKKPSFQDLEEIEESAKPNYEVALSDGEYIQFLPHQRRIKTKPYPSVNLVYFYCENKVSKDWIFASKKYHLVKYCGSINDLPWKALVRRDAIRFMESHHWPFISGHSDSLRFSIKDGFDWNQFRHVVGRGGDIKDLQRLLEKSVWTFDDDVKAYRVSAPIEAVQWVRK